MIDNHDIVPLFRNIVEELRIRRSIVEVPVVMSATRRVMRAVVERDDFVTFPNPEAGEPDGYPR